MAFCLHVDHNSTYNFPYVIQGYVLVSPPQHLLVPPGRCKTIMFFGTFCINLKIICWWLVKRKLCYSIRDRLPVFRFADTLNHQSSFPVSLPVNLSLPLCTNTAYVNLTILDWKYVTFGSNERKEMKFVNSNLKYNKLAYFKCALENIIIKF